MNKEAFKQVLKIVERSARARAKKGFDYVIWFWADDNHQSVADVLAHPCGTSGCIGGWGAILQAGKTKDGLKRPVFGIDRPSWNDARAFYEIEDPEACHLFDGLWHRDYTSAPDKDVIAKLKNIIETGKVINPDFDARYQ